MTTPVQPAFSFVPGSAVADTVGGYVPDPRTAPPIRWGILGPGGIAAKFADNLLRFTRGQVTAVGSRSRDRAQRFADDYGAPAAHAGYEELVADPSVDVVYVATPHSHHHEHALLAIEAGKHVLVEKAFTRNEAEAREVLDAAARAGVFAMEAMWTRFLPHIAALRAVVARGEIGDIVSVIADHGQSFPFDPKHRMYDPDLAGGALLDLGVYPVAFAHDIIGAPDSISAVGELTETGVDGQIGMVLRKGRTMASLSTTLWSRTPTTAAISGTEGRIEVAGNFYCPSSFRVIRRDGSTWEYRGFTDDGMQYEAAETARCIAEGRTESDRMPWQSTLEIMAAMDEVRRQVGVAYPGE